MNEEDGLKLETLPAERILVQHEAQHGTPIMPTAPSEPIKLGREDLLEYKLSVARAEKAELQVVMYTRELQRSQAEAHTIAYERRQLLQAFEKKYNVDLSSSMVTEDGYLVTRPVADPLSQLRR